MEWPFLIGAGLANDNIKTKLARVRTNLLFKQQKFNLLRETNEGYSKLIVEITSLLGPARSTSSERPTESRSALHRRAKLAWDKLVGLTGYFDLDPNRVLDIVLDVFSANALTHYPFFLELLRCSGWSRMKTVDGDDAEDSKMATDDPSNTAPESFAGMRFEDVLKKAEKAASRQGHNTDASEAPIISNILGFKLTQYQVNNAPILRTRIAHMVFVFRNPKPPKTPPSRCSWLRRS